MNQSKYYNGLRSVGRNLARRVNKTYDELVEDWRNDGKRDIDVRPSFERTIYQSSGWMEVHVKTDSLKYRYVDLGTKQHPIVPRPENTLGLLIFPKEYTPRTTVGSLEKREGGKNLAGPWVYTNYVDHPGNEPRNFELPIIEEQKPLVLDELQEFLSKTVAKLIETETKVI